MKPMPDYSPPPALLEAIVRSATDYAIITLDASRQVTSWNPGASVLLGWSPAEIAGQSGDLIFTPEDRARDAPGIEIRQAQAEGRAEDERWHVRKDGSRFWGSGVIVPLRGEDGFLKIMTDRTKERQAELAVQQSELRFRTLAEHIPQLVWRSARLGHRTWPSPQWIEFTGQSAQESIGLGWLDAVHPQDRELTIEAWHEAERTGQLYVEHRTRRAADGEYRWFQTRATRLVSSDNGETEWFGTSIDVHDMRRALERQEVLTRELHHRTRNLLGIVTSLARQTLKRCRSLEDFEARFTDRIAALSRVQALVSRSEASEIALRNLIEAEVMAHAQEADGRVIIEGPQVNLHEKASETLALAVHELATNAVKYGALAASQGRLKVSWSVKPDALEVEWHESGVAKPPSNAGRGYGRELIEVALPFALGATTRLEFLTDGIYCSIKLPDHEWQRGK
jgi:PAS domain S-box-containing protein